jgi:hypothetical protein
MWFSETGVSNPNAAAQAGQAIKVVVHAASTGVTRVMLHGLWSIPGWDDGGVLENTPSGQVPVRRLSFTAYQTLLRIIGKNEGVRRLGPGQYRAALPGGGAVYVLWAEAGGGKLDFQGRLRVTDLKGRPRELDAKELTLTGQPVFVERIK